MIAAPRTGWQTLVADLSIILFMLTAGALSRGQPASPHRRSLSPTVGVPAARAPTARTPGQAEPLALYRQESGGPTLDAWLAGQPIDPRQQLTVVVRYRPGDEATIPARVAALFQASARARVRTRIMLEPGDGTTSAGLAFDASS